MTTHGAAAQLAAENPVVSHVTFGPLDDGMMSAFHTHGRPFECKSQEL
jgi:hypothetical protein